MAYEALDFARNERIVGLYFLIGAVVGRLTTADQIEAVKPVSSSGSDKSLLSYRPFRIDQRSHALTTDAKTPQDSIITSARLMNMPHSGIAIHDRFSDSRR